MKRSKLDYAFGLVGAFLIAAGLYVNSADAGLMIVIGSALFFKYLY